MASGQEGNASDLRGSICHRAHDLARLRRRRYQRSMVQRFVQERRDRLGSLSAQLSEDC